MDVAVSGDNTLALERLKEKNANLEIWWDSHPGLFKLFLAQLQEKGTNQESLNRMRRWMSHNEGGFFFFDGVTTNPPLVLKYLQTYPQVVERVKEWGKSFKDSDGRSSWFDLEPGFPSIL